MKLLLPWICSIYSLAWTVADVFFITNEFTRDICTSLQMAVYAFLFIQLKRYNNITWFHLHYRVVLYPTIITMGIVWGVCIVHPTSVMFITGFSATFNSYVCLFALTKQGKNE
jgi:hypothetical protein